MSSEGASKSAQGTSESASNVNTRTGNGGNRGDGKPKQTGGFSGMTSELNSHVFQMYSEQRTRGQFMIIIK